MPPRIQRCQRTDRLTSLCRLALPALIAAISAGAQAEGNTPATSGADNTAAERAKREADKVFQWIRIQSDKPKKAAASATAERAAPAPAVPAKATAKAASKSQDNGITEAAHSLPASASPRAEPKTGNSPTVTAVAQPEPVSLVLAAKTDMSAPLAAVSAPAVEADEDLALTPVYKADPGFPPSVMRTLRKGQVQVGFTVRPDGTVADAHAVTSTSPRLVSSAVASVSQWRFQPLHHAQQGVVELGFDLD